MKKILLMAMSAMMFFACSKDQDNFDPTKDNSAYMALQLSTPTPTKANTAVDGTENESKMTKATVLLFDANEKCLGSVDFTTFTGNPATEAKSVPAKTKKVFVVVNPNTNKWNLSNATVAGKSWDDINTYVAVAAADISKNDEFLMTNSGTLAGGALVSVTVYATSALAKATPAEIWVDRVASKVILKTNPAITVTPAGAQFAFKGWELNTVNKMTALYSQRVPFTGETGAVAAIYRRDNNYFKQYFGTSDPDITTYIKANYAWLTNGTSATDISAVLRPAYVDDATTATGKAYVAENTMEADAQLWGHTTKVVVKGAYTPAGITTDANYFAYKSKYYDVATLKTEYMKPERTDLKADLVIFLKAAFPAGTTYGDLSDANKLLQTNIDAAIDALDAYSGILAKYKAVTYYHASICYYDALIRHDSSISTAMALGRYGVVRNNAYELTINNVKGPGTPWIPDPTNPDDPSKSTDPDDEVDANLSINVKLNKWTHWTQGVDLGN